MRRLGCFKKLLLTATVCAVSCVGRGEREKIKISLPAKLQIMNEVEDFFKTWMRSDAVICGFYKSHLRVIIRDSDHLVSVLTNDLLEYLAWGADEYRSFQEFQRDRLLCYSQEDQRWQWVRDFLVYAFNACVPIGGSGFGRGTFYGLGIFNYAAKEKVGLNNSPNLLYYRFFETTGAGTSLLKWTKKFFSGSEVRKFCKRVFKILWADVQRWFEETDPDAVLRRQEGYLAFFRWLGMTPERCEEFFEKSSIFKELRDFRRGQPEDKRTPVKANAFILDSDHYGHGGCFLLPAFDLWKEKELFREEIGGAFALEADTKRKILDAIKKYLEERYGSDLLLSGKVVKDHYLRVDRLSFFKADCAVLFRFFTQRIVKDFLAPEKYEKLSPEERRKFIRLRKDKGRFPRYVTAGAKEVFGFLMGQTFKYSDSEGGCSRFETEEGFELNYLNLMVNELTLFDRSWCFTNTDKGRVLDFKEAFEPSFLKTIADLLYPELEAHLDKLSAEIEEDAKK